MGTLTKQAGLAGALVSLMAVAGAASAAPITMDFDQMDTVDYVAGNPFVRGQYVADYYNDGCGAMRSGLTPNCDGPDYGVAWSPSTVVFPQPGLPGAFGGVAGAPSGPNVIGNEGKALGRNGIIMNVANGFDTSLSFWYATTSYDLLVTVYDDVNGTGNVLADKQYAWQIYCQPGMLMSCWSEATVDFADTARSVRFQVNPDIANQSQFVLDNISFNIQGGDTPSVPEPAAIGVFGLGTLLVGLFVARRRRLG